MTKAGRRTRPRIGDVVRIVTADGSAFAQYIHKNAEFGALVRVVGPDTGDGSSPDEAAAIAARPTQFVTFFPLGAACHRRIAEILGAAPIPPGFSAFPRFRQALRLDPSSRGPCNWLIWDGRREWVVPRLTDEQKQYPLREIVNDTLLVERALSNWTASLET